MIRLRRTRSAARPMISSTAMWVEVFFFFQAEDGIRDIGVTGVQTCALPISCAPSIDRPTCPADLLKEAGLRGMSADQYWERKRARVPEEEILRELGLLGLAPNYLRQRLDRSEGRRVGKECRSRWSPYHLKKK